MKFTCFRSRFAYALATVCEVVSARATKPMLQNIFLRPDGKDRLLMSGMDMDIGMQYQMDVQDLIDPEPILVPAHRLNALAQGDRSEKWSVATEKGKVKIATARGALTVLGFSDTDEFPSISGLAADDADVITARGDDIALAVAKTAFCVARGDSRYALNGIFLKIAGATVEFAASDTHRLSRFICPIGNPKSLDGSGIVLARGLTILAKMVAGQEAVTLKLTAKELIVRSIDATLSIRLLDGQFPNYTGVIPDKAVNEVTVEREEFAHLLRLAGHLSDSETRIVGLRPEADKISLHTEENEVGQAQLGMTAAIVGTPVEMKFNHLFLIDLCKAVSDASLVLRMVDESTPMRVDSGGFTHIIMPLRR